MKIIQKTLLLLVISIIAANFFSCNNEEINRFSEDDDRSELGKTGLWFNELILPEL